jgi:hypothetical protein
MLGRRHDASGRVPLLTTTPALSRHPSLFKEGSRACRDASTAILHPRADEGCEYIPSTEYKQWRIRTPVKPGWNGDLPESCKGRTFQLSTEPGSLRLQIQLQQSD